MEVISGLFQMAVVVGIAYGAYRFGFKKGYMEARNKFEEEPTELGLTVTGGVVRDTDRK